MTTRSLSGTPPVAEQDPLTPAEAYERFAVPALFAPAAELLLAAATPAPGERSLDVGTGTGIVARRAAPRVGPAGLVAGLDASPEMLQVARATSASDGLPIDWHLGAAERLPFPDASFDLVLSQFALMFFDDRDAALAEMHRVLTPGGRVVFSVFQEIARHPFYVALNQAVIRQLATPAVATIFALGDADALATTLSRAGFRDASIEPDSLTAHMGPPEQFLTGEIELDTAAIPAMQALAPGERRQLIAAIEEEMAGPLRDVTANGEVVIDFHLLIARALC